jgi:hypothetical protein
LKKPSIKSRPADELSVIPLKDWAKDFLAPANAGIRTFASPLPQRGKHSKRGADCAFAVQNSPFSAQVLLPVDETTN